MTAGDFNSAHILYTFSGALPGGEEWTVGLRTVAAAPTAAFLSAAALDLGVLFQTMLNTGLDGVFRLNPAGVTFTKVTARAVDIHGITTIVEERSDFGATGSAADQHCPNQTALVFTLKTSRAGKSGKGRVYLPLLSPAALDANGRISGTVTDHLATNFATFLTAVDAYDHGGAEGPFEIAVQSKVFPGAAAPVTSVAVGNVLDTQRRRRDKLVEVYASVDVVV